MNRIPIYEEVMVPSAISAHGCGFGVPFNDGIEYESIYSGAVEGVKEPFVIVIDGDSMEPTLVAGDKLVIDHSAEPKRNDIVSVYLNGEYLVKRYEVRGFSVFLKSDNIMYTEIKIKESDNFEILGTGVNIIRKIRR